MEWIESKHILKSSKPTDQYLSADFNMNLYRGCSHGCIYCDSRSSCYQIENFSTVRAKLNAIEILEQDMRQKRKRGLIATGAMSDPYNPEEKRHELTRKALSLADRYGFGISITTKSALVLRDIDLLKKISKHSSVAVHITISTAYDKISRIVEPNVSLSSERFEAIRALSDAGLFAGVLMMPVLPFIEDSEENLLDMLSLCQKSSAKSIIALFGMTLRQGNREYYYAALDKHFPGMKERYRQYFRQNYYCSSPNSAKLYKKFRSESKRLKLLHSFRDINNVVMNMHGKQLSLF